MRHSGVVSAQQCSLQHWLTLRQTTCLLCTQLACCPVDIAIPLFLLQKPPVLITLMLTAEGLEVIHDGQLLHPTQQIPAQPLTPVQPKVIYDSQLQQLQCCLP
jgi:hypothetical protein